MGFEIINMGAAPTGVGGDTVRTGFDKVNRNLAQLKDRALQPDYSTLSGQLYREVGVMAVSNYVNAFTLKTKVPSAGGIAPMVRLHGCLATYTSPITIDLSWYFYDGKIVAATALVNTSSREMGTLAANNGLQIILYEENGLANLYLKFPARAYYPRFAVSCLNTGALAMPGGQESDWGIVVDGPPPAAALQQVPFTIVSTLNTANCKVGNDGTIKVA